MKVSTYKKSVTAAQDWWFLYRETKNVTVFYVDLQPHEMRETEALARLDGEEQARWHRFRHARARYEFSLCRAALRSILCHRLGCRNEELSFGTSKYGKPFACVDGGTENLDFNVSHSNRHGLIALAPHGRVGVDVEERNPRKCLDGELQSVFTRNERIELGAVRGKQKTHLFFRLWTMKEALLKALGTGFSLDMSRIEIPKAMRQGMRAGEFRFPQLPAVRWWLENLDDPGFAAAIAYELGTVGAVETGKIPA